MFGFFKKKIIEEKSSPISQLLALPTGSFNERLLASLASTPPNGWMMTLVALENVSPLFMVAKDQGLAKSSDDYIRLLQKMIDSHRDDDDLGKRRLHWLLLAALVKRASNISKGTPELEEQAARIWIYLAKGSKHIGAALATNALWTDEEKAYFSHIIEPAEGVWYTLNIMLPLFLVNHLLIENFAEDEGVFLTPANLRTIKEDI